MKPNIVVFMTDQQNASTVCPDSPAKTPNLDAFRKKATQFTQCYTTSPHCCPSRAGFFSGLYPSEHGVWNNVEVDGALTRGLFDDVTLFPEQLQAEGYHTMFSGKWHVSAYEGPESRGFQEILRDPMINFGRRAPTNKPMHNDWEKVYNSPEKLDLNVDPSTREEAQIIRQGYQHYVQYGTNENPYRDIDSVDAACQAIQEYDKDQPFFLYVGTQGPHDPYFPPQDFLDLYQGEEIPLPESFSDDMLDKPALYRRTRDRFALTEAEQRECMRRYMAFVSFEDHLFGRILNSLDGRNFTENTIIIYTTDHGDYLGAHRLWTKGLPCFQEAYRLPALVSGPGVKHGAVCDQFVSLIDFAPTILEFAGLRPERKISGKSLVPLLNGSFSGEFRSDYFTQTNGNEVYGIQRAVWNKKWKYVLNTFDYDELYDLENDPDEVKNLLPNPEYQPMVEEMCKKIWDFAKETGDNCTCGYITTALAPVGPGVTLL